MHGSSGYGPHRLGRVSSREARTSASSPVDQPLEQLPHMEEDDRFPAEDLGAADLQIVIAACAGKSGNLGLAYVDVDAPERILHVADVVDPQFTELNRLKRALLGTGRRHGMCVLPAKSPPDLVRVAEEGVEESPFPVAVLKGQDFDFDQCRQRILVLKFGEHDEGAEMEDRNSTNHTLRGQAIVDLTNEQLVRVTGGLLRFLERNRAQLGDLDYGRQTLRLHDVRVFSPANLLCVDAQTMAALQVFSEDPHPSLIRGVGRAKEGMSLYGTLEPFLASTTGRATLRRWLRQPSRDLALLRERQDAIEELLRPRHRELIRSVHQELREVRDLSTLLARVFGCYQFNNVQDWRTLMTTFEHMSAAFSMLQADVLGTALTQLHDSGGLTSDIAAVSDMLSSVVDLEASISAHEVKVCRGIDEQLDSVRDQYDSIDSYLTKVAALEQQRLRDLGINPGLVATVTFHYFPQLGFHASVPNPLATDGEEENASTMEALKRRAPAPSEDWHYQFAGTGRLFYKCPLALRLDSEIGDLLVAARELELELLLGVVDRLQKFEPRLCRAAQILADFDVLVALSSAAAQFGWYKPKLLANSSCLHLVRGRHPLVEADLAGRRGFVPNDTHLDKVQSGDEGDRQSHQASHVQVVTGANLAGKSVYLKQVGLIVILAQIGSFVPAEEAEIGLCDLMFSRIQSHESATIRCSAFGLDLTQVALALRHATPHSLVLLDEFGKGTHAADGVALLGAVVEHLLKWKHSPRAIVTTHFTEVFRFGLVRQDVSGLQLSSMRVLPPDGNREDISYLYQLVPGVSDRSFGLECAKKAGVDPSVVERAAAILSSLERGVALAPPPTLTTIGKETTAHNDPRSVACHNIVDRLCAINPDDTEAVRSLLGYVWSQQALLCSGSSGGA